VPRDSSETLALLLSHGLLGADRDDHAIGHPLVYGPTPRLLHLLGAETLEEAREKLTVPADYQSEAKPGSKKEPTGCWNPGRTSPANNGFSRP
jgi:hypothetical protein